MGTFASAFTLTMLHTLWQSALLYLVYATATALIKNSHPHARRNFLFIMLGIQLVISAFTFYIYFSGTENLYAHALSLTIGSNVSGNEWFSLAAPWVVSTYAIVAGIKTLSLIYHWIGFNFHYSPTIEKAPLDLRLFTSVKATEFGIRKKILLGCSARVNTPVTYGFFKPVILLPVALVNHLSLNEVETLIIHELTHIKNNDYLLNFLLLFAETIFFFNPFIRKIAQHIRLEREKNCDMQVMDFQYSPVTYAETLLKVARLKPTYRTFVMGAVSKQQQLLHRIKFFTGNDKAHFGKKNYLALSYLLIILFFCVNVFTLSGIKKDNIFSASTLTPGFSPQLMLDGHEEKMMEIVPLLESVVSTVESKIPEIEAKVKTLEPIIIEAQRQIEELEWEDVKLPSIRVSAAEPVVKEVIITNEDPRTGTSFTEAYKLTFQNGEWIKEPLWFHKEIKIKDTTAVAIDSVYRPFNVIQ